MGIQMGLIKRIGLLSALLAMALAGNLVYGQEPVIGQGGGGSEQKLTFGIVPQQSAKKLAKLWTPILERLSQETGYKIEFRTAKDIPTFEKRLAKGEYDLSYMNPYHYTVFHDRSGYEAIAKAKDKKIKGIIVVHKDNKVSSLKELDGKKLAFPSPAAFAASILTRSELKSAGATIVPVYVSTHDSVYRNVASKRMVAGGGVMRTFKSVAPDVRDELKILWTTKGYTPHAIAVSPKVSEDVSGKVAKALLDLMKDDAGRAMLQALKIKGFETAENADWDDVRALGVSEL